MQSFERRLEKLDGWIADIESGRISIEDLRSRQQRLDKEVHDTLDEKTADEEGAESDREESEVTQ
ncbi:MAG TPA: hypothetical protein DCE56_02130, partial [Cyanobacteria bacterium UBA8553]|nr:hypothetical protein [Cyanobacteria bacterium UBA8553]